jgi:nucleotide-binding universal stress UspA family protein
MSEQNPQLPRNVIVVGTDGGPDSTRAIAYAVAEARRQRQGLRLVHVVPEAVPMSAMLPLYGVDSLRTVGAQILAAAADTVHELAGDDVELDSVLAHGPRVPALLAHTADASLVVLGRRSSTLARIRTGSTTSAAASRADCPVVAVPEEWTTAPERGHVVAAVDGTAANIDVLHFAFAAAQQRKGDVVVVHAWRPLPPYDVALDSSGAVEAWRSQTEPMIWALVAGLRADFPEVEVRVDLVFDSVADALVAAGRDADLLVMGRRGEGAHFGTALGSKARAVLRAGVCPVEIIPTRRPEPPAVPRQAVAREVPDDARTGR